MWVCEHLQTVWLPTKGVFFSLNLEAICFTCEICTNTITLIMFGVWVWHEMCTNTITFIIFGVWVWHEICTNTINCIIFGVWVRGTVLLSFRYVYIKIYTHSVALLAVCMYVCRCKHSIYFLALCIYIGTHAQYCSPCTMYLCTYTHTVFLSLHCVCI
jgi:hypothetical protein